MKRFFALAALLLTLNTSTGATMVLSEKKQNAQQSAEGGDTQILSSGRLIIR